MVLLDWDLATAGTPSVEFAWYLCHDAWRIDAGHDELEADFRAAEGDRLDERELELGMLSGLVQYGWIFGHSLRVHPDPAETEWARRSSTGGCRGRAAPSSGWAECRTERGFGSVEGLTFARPGNARAHGLARF